MSTKICICFGQLLSLSLGHYAIVLSLSMFMSQGHISGFFRLGAGVKLTICDPYILLVT